MLVSSQSLLSERCSMGAGTMAFQFSAMESGNFQRRMNSRLLVGPTPGSGRLRPKKLPLVSPAWEALALCWPHTEEQLDSWGGESLLGSWDNPTLNPTHCSSSGGRAWGLSGNPRLGLHSGPRWASKASIRTQGYGLLWMGWKRPGSGGQGGGQRAG